MPAENGRSTPGVRRASMLPAPLFAAKLILWIPSRSGLSQTSSGLQSGLAANTHAGSSAVRRKTGLERQIPSEVPKGPPAPSFGHARPCDGPHVETTRSRPADAPNTLMISRNLRNNCSTSIPKMGGGGQTKNGKNSSPPRRSLYSEEHVSSTYHAPAAKLDKEWT